MDHRTPPPAPQPLCAVFEPLLPLLSQGWLDTEETAATHAHVATCAWCQSHLRDLDFLRDALRHLNEDEQNGLDGDLPVSRPFTWEDLMKTADQEPHTLASPIPLLPRRRPSGRLTALATIAALFVVALLAGVLLTLRATLGNHPSPRPTPSPQCCRGVTEFPLPASGRRGPGDITVGPDGNLWFTEVNAFKIGRITPSGTLTEFPLPGIHRNPQYLAASPDGNIWFTEQVGEFSPTDKDYIGRLAPGGAVTEYPLPTLLSNPLYIVVGPDGNLWFTELGTDTIGRITPAGTLTEFPLPAPCAVSCGPAGIVTGSDGNLWFTESGANKIGRITPTGAITEFSVPTAGSAPWAITAGPDGNLWFVEVVAGKIGRITPAGVVTEFPTPSGTPLPNVESPRPGTPQGIAAGSDGNLWFTEVKNGKIGRITPEGVVTEFPLPPGSQPILPASVPVYFIVAGPDGNLWFNELSADKIGRLDPRQVVPVGS